MCEYTELLFLTGCSHLVEPRFDEFKSAAEKGAALDEMGLGQAASLQPFRDVLVNTKIIVAGGFGPDNYEESISSGVGDLVAFGRFFVYVHYIPRDRIYGDGC